jgi:DNA-binding NarL/FixJ family response regulator
VRLGLRQLLATEPGFAICGEAADGREAVEKARQLKPDVVLLDISMPALNGLETTHQILKALPQNKMLILTVHESEELAASLLSAERAWLAAEVRCRPRLDHRGGIGVQV